MDPRETLQGHYPVVRTETAQFGRRVDLSGGLKIYGSVTFEATILWLRISQTKVNALAEDGTVLKSYDCPSDFYGLLHSTLDMPQRVEEMCRLFSVDTHSALRVEARLIVVDHPVVYAYDEQDTPTYQKIPLDWRYSDDPGFEASGTHLAATARSRWIEPKTVADQPIWTSCDLSETARQTTYDAAITAALQGLPDDLKTRTLASLVNEKTRRRSRAA